MMKVSSCRGKKEATVSTAKVVTAWFFLIIKEKFFIRKLSRNYTIYLIGAVKNELSLYENTDHLRHPPGSHKNGPFG